MFVCLVATNHTGGVRTVSVSLPGCIQLSICERNSTLPKADGVDSRRRATWDALGASGFTGEGTAYTNISNTTRMNILLGHINCSKDRPQPCTSTHWVSRTEKQATYLFLRRMIPRSSSLARLRNRKRNRAYAHVNKMKATW